MENSQQDKLSFMEVARGRRATKLWKKNEIEGYDAGALFSHRSIIINDLKDLSDNLKAIESNPRCFIIRGQLKPIEELKSIKAYKTSTKQDVPFRTANGKIWRQKVGFDDIPLHSCMIDIDNFIPENINPITNPTAAIDQYIEKILPACFQHKSYHWQLSSSAGAPRNEGKLKAHVWFWLKNAYTCAQLRAWAQPYKPAVDASLFDTIQIHYTAGPIFEEGVVDPVPNRSGFKLGLLDDEVELIIDEITLLKIESTKLSKKNAKHRDACDAPGPIGAFNRVTEWNHLFNEHLEGTFEFTPGYNSSVSWLVGDHAPKGLYIVEDQLIGSSHNSDPCKNKLVNKFDFLRIHKFGHLDDIIEAELDPFEQFCLSINERPSYSATLDYVKSLPEVESDLVARKSLENTSSDKTVIEVLSVSELMKLPSMTWHVKTIVPSDGLGLLYGESGCGKTFAALDLALSIGRGEDWRGKKVKKSGVVYLAAEGGIGIKNRVDAYQQYHDLDLEKEDAAIGFITRSVNLLEGDDFMKMITACNTLNEKGHKIGLIVFDTLNRVMPGGDENSSVDMGNLIQNAKDIQEATGAFVLLVHHSGKNAALGARGHSSLRAAVDTEIEVKRDGDIRILRITKQRDGSDGVEMAFKLHQVKIALDEDLESITSCVAIPADLSEANSKKPKPQGKWQESVYNAVVELTDKPLLSPENNRMKVLRNDVFNRVKELQPKSSERWKESAKRALEELILINLVMGDTTHIWVN